jgi:Cd2+/Zn2+-exporting ATPase
MTEPHVHPRGAEDVASAPHCPGCETPAEPSKSVPRGASFRIPTMDCTVEESEIRRALEPLDGIHRLNFQLGARTLSIQAAPGALEPALAAIRQAGFRPEPLANLPAGTGDHHADGDAHGHGARAPGMKRLVLALVLATAAELIEFVAPEVQSLKYAGMAISLAAIGLAGIDTYAKGLGALRRFKLNINALMSVAVTGAFVIGQWPEAAMVMALYAIAEMIEARSVDRARHAIKGLLAMAPEQAEVRQADGSWKASLASEVPLDAIVRLRPGERVPLDGIVTRGSSALDQSAVTGESIPVDKTVEDPVFAGTINQTGELEFKVTAVSANTTLARIIQAVEQAQDSRAPTQRFVDRFAAIYTPTVFLLALAVAILPPLALDWTWTESVYKALVLLVIGCPCALVISTPVTVVSALAAAAKRGILIKGGTHLENARRIGAVALDKTGTLTEVKPRLVAWESIQGEKADHGRIAAALAGRSDHPVSKAILAGLESPSAEVGDFKALAGRGVEGLVDGQRYALGNHRLAKERGFGSPALDERMRGVEDAGRTVTLLLSPTGPLAIFAVADTLKASSREAIAELAAMGVTSVLLTGDNQATAASIAKAAGIREAQGNLLPEDKLAAIEALQREHGVTAMAGDGINDAPALARSDIGIAMGGAGTDTAMEAADIVIMNDDLRRIPETIRLSRHAHAVLWQNISIALGIKLVFLVLAVFGSATMWMAVFADMGASLLVVANGLRLQRGVGSAKDAP